MGCDPFRRSYRLDSFDVLQAVDRFDRPDRFDGGYFAHNLAPCLT
jgi:hypothetical protein